MRSDLCPQHKRSLKSLYRHLKDFVIVRMLQLENQNSHCG